ncbi:MAG: hypothetical protein KDI17_14010 [Halioglobus sp.]|nr:hypothetical protein [Halioglobus sp.]
MKKLFLHIGLGKTGSSALQSWLSLNSAALSQRGVDYADLVPHAKTGEVSSGNGYDLQRALIGHDFEEVERLLTSTYFFNPKNDVALISCELFQGIRAPFVQKIHDICAKCEIDVTIIVYIRSVYEQQYSSYLQGIKRSSIAHRFGEMSSDIAFHRSVEYLRRYVRVFGDKVIAVNYDIAKKDIYASLADIIGLDTTGLKKLEKKVNRSLTLEEAEVLRRMNRFHGGVFATTISDFVIALSPNIETPIVYDRGLVQRVRDATEEDLLWVNQQFNIPVPVASDNYDGHSSAEPPVLTADSYKPVVQWALAFDPGKALRADFADFLQQFAVFLEDISVADAQALEGRLERVRRELEKDQKDSAAETVTGSEQPTSAAGKTRVRKPAHIITYFYDSDTLSSEQQAHVGARFKDWQSCIEKHAVGSAVNGVVTTRLLGADESAREAPMTGYSLLELDDMDAVLSLAGKCPLLEVGGVVEVSRAVNLLDMW